jgi:hypothetical protein
MKDLCFIILFVQKLQQCCKINFTTVNKEMPPMKTILMEDERFADAVRRYNQGTQDDCRSVAEKIFKRLKKYGGRLLQTHRSGAGRSPIIGFTSLNDVDAKESE